MKCFLSLLLLLALLVPAAFAEQGTDSATETVQEIAEGSAEEIAEEPVEKAAIESGTLGLSILYYEQDGGNSVVSDLVPLYSDVVLCVLPAEGIAFEDLDWKSSDQDVLAFEGSDDAYSWLWFTAVKAGTTTLTVFSRSDSKIRASVRVTVYSGTKPLNLYFADDYGAPTTLLKYYTEKDAIGQKSGPLENLVIEPAEIRDQVKLTWKSSKPKVLKMAKDGSSVLKSFGTTKVTVTAQYGKEKKSASATVTIMDWNELFLAQFTEHRTGTETQMKTAKIAIDTEDLDLSEDLLIEPSGLRSECTVTWKSGNTRIAEVDSAGRLTLKKEGSVKITAKVTLGKKTKTAAITLKVYDPVKPTKVTIGTGTKMTKYLNGNDVVDLGPILSISAPKPDPEKYTVTWSSSKPSVASIDEKGVMTLRKKGTAKITAVVKYGSFTKKATCTVTVKVPAMELNKYIGKPVDELIAVYALDYTFYEQDGFRYFHINSRYGQIYATASDQTGRIYDLNVRDGDLTLFGIGKKTGMSKVEAIARKKGFRNKVCVSGEGKDAIWYYLKGELKDGEEAIIVEYNDGLPYGVEYTQSLRIN